MRAASLSIAIAVLASAGAASAAPLVGFSDNTPLMALTAFMADDIANHAMGWTQSVGSSNVTVRALLSANPQAPQPANWWITDAIGPGATGANVIASGTYVAPPIDDPTDLYDFDTWSYTTLATGLSFGPGAYYLVLDGAEFATINANAWLGGVTNADSVNLAQGFALNGLYSASVGFSGAGAPPADFGPSSAFTRSEDNYFLAFQLDGDVTGAVPEPATWALMIAGFGLAGATLRRRNAIAA